MAIGAIRTILSAMVIIFRMAGITIGRCALVDIVDMAAGTSHLAVGSCQFKGRQVVIEGRWKPTTGRMTEGTVRSILPTMRIVLCMAGITARWGASIGVIGMTICAGNLSVLPGQYEGSQVMVKSSRSPGAGCMARRTIRPQ